ncbi:tubby C-terminal-like domain-containing protein [Achaetomium macrosporum]|uniref:Tubby C-terminal-like domain-containing protein n=1 Tax=Achaetomium macrosporum TaxID=79813 RepID=A0AAN7C669_9PEZI|nr:tubby C-terminal-like domain-containing protein [Achaetomium macrosporum]
MADLQLQPAKQPLAIFDHMVPQQTTTLVLKEMGDHFDVKTLNKGQLMNVKAKLSLHGRKKCYDAGGRHLFDIVRQGGVRLRPTFLLQGEDKKQYMEVKRAWSWFGFKAKATFTSARTNTPVTLLMKGRFRNKTKIVDEASGALVGRIDKKLFKMREMALGQQTYHLTVAPGVDMALLVAMGICLDEMQNEGQNKAMF